MKKLIILVILISFFTGCSNLVRREEITLKEKENLVLLVENIKSGLQQGDTTLFEKTLTSGIRNNFVKNEIQNIDFSKINIFSSKPQFLGTTATNMVGFNVQGTTLYYEVEYELKKGEWKIVKFKERRG